MDDNVKYACAFEERFKPRSEIDCILHVFKLSRISYHISHKGPEAHVNLKRTQNNCFFFNYYYCLKFKSSTYIKYII